MKYSGMPAFMWHIYRKSFRNHLTSDLGFDVDRAKCITAKAKPRYKSIIEKLPAFEKGDRFKTNIVNCSMLISFLQSMDRRPSAEELTEYYAKAMSTGAARFFFRIGGKKKFTDKDIAGMQKTALFNAADRNPYSWNMDFLPYEDNSGYEARFSKCGICVLMKEYGFFDLVPAMCNFDYVMSDMGGTTRFVREYTLASGGPYCDCGYKKKNFVRG